MRTTRNCGMPGQRSCRFRLEHALLFWALVLMASTDLSAQVTSTFQGYISDPHGGSVPDAKVTATHEETGVSRSTTSAQDGYYRIPDLLAGTYRLAVERSGFKTMVRSGVVLNAKTVAGQNFALELGEVTQSITVNAEGSQVETQTIRINDVIKKTDLESLPMLGRTPVSLVYTSPGITGKFESLGSSYCCDVFSSLRSPDVSSTGGPNEFKNNYTVDGVSFRYGDGPQWGMSFMPNPDALEEVNVSTSSYTAETGSLSGPQVQLVTKGGTNAWHGSAHYTFRNDDLSAVPFRSTREAVPDSFYRLFGGTFGGPIKKDRIFGFFAYEGLRAKTANSNVALSETEAFKNWVVSTRPNSTAAKLLQDFPPIRYPQTNLVDLNGDGVADIGDVTVDTPIRRGGRQLNGRIDYNFPNAKDRIYGSYWYNRPDQTGSDLHPAFAINDFIRVHYGNFAYSRAFSPNVLNEARFGISDSSAVFRNSGAYHVPYIATDDGLSLGNYAWALDVWQTRVTELGDTLSINRGKHGIKVGGGYVDRHLAYQSYILGDTPEYYFASVFDFADDKPYLENRNLDVKSGQANKTDAIQGQRELYFFMQNTWQVRPNFTLNYGVRWQNFFSPWLKLAGKETWQPVLTSDQLTPSGVAQAVNRRVDRHTDYDWNNFGPRISVAWDPSGKGKMSVRGNFGVLYDELDALHHYNTTANPPGTAYVSAGEQYGVPIVYGLAPVGTRDFPVNPNLKTPQLSPEGGFVGARPALAGFVKNLRVPITYDHFVGIQYQLFRDIMVFGNYRYRRTTNDVYADDLNRFEGDLLDGLLDRLNPNFDTINMLYNNGKRIYHGLVFGASKRFSSGWSIDAHYTYNNAKNNFGSVGQFADSNSTVPYKPEVDYARDDIAHVFTFRNVWELPIFRKRTDLLGKILGGWQLNSIWNLQSGSNFIPLSFRQFGQGGDFNADGRTGDRPDKPTADVPRSFSKSEWLDGALQADIFPLPDPSQPRAGTLPRDYFRGPGYARIDISAGKSFRVTEKSRVDFRAEAFNALNRVNISRVANSISASNFGRATSAYLMRVIQFNLKFTF